MYTTMFSIVLATAAAASDGQGGGYGGYGSYGSYGTYSGSSGNQHYIWPNNGWQVVDFGRQEDSRVRDLQKSVSDLTTLLSMHVQKLKDIENSVHAQQNMTEVHKQMMDNMQKTVAETIDRRMGTQPVADYLSALKEHDQKFERIIIELKTGFDAQMKTVLDNQRVTISQLEARQIALEEKSRQETTNAVLLKMMVALETISKANPDIRDTLVDIRSVLKKDQFTSAPVTGSDSTRAMIIVSLPADAKLFVDNQVSNPGSNLRTFVSPPLELNKNYFYNLRVELVRGGKVYTTPRKVTFQAGREIHVNFDQIERDIVEGLKIDKGN